jgi:hypothetical protein
MTRHSYALPENFDRWSVIEHTHVDGAAILPDEFVCDNCHLVAYAPRSHVHYIASNQRHWCADCDDDWRERVREAFKPPAQTAGTGPLAAEHTDRDPDYRNGTTGALSGEPTQAQSGEPPTFAGPGTSLQAWW